MKNNHSKEFFIKKYEQLKGFALYKGINFPFKNVRELESTWNALRADGTKNVYKSIKYGMQYNTDYKTALAEYRALKEVGIENVKLKSLKEITTTEFAKEHESDILNMYHTMRAQGLSGEAAGAYISTYWFGSE